MAAHELGRNPMQTPWENLRKLMGTETKITPLLDLVFVLLIIFIITAAKVQNDLPVSLPEAGSQPASDAAADNKKGHTVTIYPTMVFLDDEACSLADLAQRIQSSSSNPAEPPSVVVRADGNIAYQRIVDVLDVLNNAGLNQVQLATTVQK
jgi:biopolymer transport protein ExbD